MNGFNGFISPQDVVVRLLRRHRIWFHGEPTVALDGEEGSFGTLKFDFGDEVVEYKIYIHNRDIILDAVWIAIKNFSQMADEYYEMMC